MSLADSSLAGWVTAFCSVVGALTALGGMFVLLIPILRSVKATHKIVNQEKTNRLNFQRALIRALKDAGVEVPIDQSVESDEPV